MLQCLKLLSSNIKHVDHAPRGGVLQAQVPCRVFIRQAHPETDGLDKCLETTTKWMHGFTILPSVSISAHRVHVQKSACGGSSPSWAPPAPAGAASAAAASGPQGGPGARPGARRGGTWQGGNQTKTPLLGAVCFFDEDSHVHHFVGPTFFLPILST